MYAVETSSVIRYPTVGPGWRPLASEGPTGIVPNAITAVLSTPASDALPADPVPLPSWKGVAKGESELGEPFSFVLDRRERFGQQGPEFCNVAPRAGVQATPLHPGRRPAHRQGPSDSGARAAAGGMMTRPI